MLFMLSEIIFWSLKMVVNLDRAFADAVLSFLFSVCCSLSYRFCVVYLFLCNPPHMKYRGQLLSVLAKDISKNAGLPVI